MESELHENIKAQFSCFGSKNQLQDYYMSYEFPEKQQKLYELWKKLLLFVCKAQGRLTFSRRQLAEQLVFYRMKPLPLDPIVRQLLREGHIVDRNKVGQSKEKEQTGGLIGRAWNYLFKQQASQNISDTFFFKQYAQEVLATARRQLSRIFQNQKSILQPTFVKALQKELYLKGDGELLQQMLVQQSLIKKVPISVMNISANLIIYNEDPSKLNTQYINLQKTEWMLVRCREEIDVKIQQKTQNMERIRETAKKCIKNGNKLMAKEYIQEMKMEEEGLTNMLLRRRLLGRQLNNLENSQGNMQILQSIERSQKQVLRLSSEINLDRLSQLAVSQEEIKKNFDEVQMLYEKMAGNDKSEEQEIFRELQKQTEKQLKEKNIKLPSVIPIGSNLQKPELIQIEQL